MPIASINSLVLPDGGPWLRDHAIPEGSRERDYDDRYDFHTLAYDVVSLPQFRAVCLICPRLFNLEKLLRAGRFTSEHGRHRILKIHRLRRYDEIWLWAPRTPRRLTFTQGDLEITCAVTPQNRDIFRGLRAATTLSKNNDLEWIRDWVTWHVRMHGLEGMLVYDNGSDRYGVEDLDAMLGGIPGLQAHRVVSAPHRFGPHGHAPHAFRSNFLQPALLNLARVRFLSRAGVVLQADIAELFVSDGEDTVFDAATRSPFGYALFEGTWRYAPEVAGPRPSFRDHVQCDPSSSRPETKYCICPRRPFGVIHWEAHGVVKGFMKKKFIRPDIRYLHCAQIATHWKSGRGLQTRERLVNDPETEAKLDSVFPRRIRQGAASAIKAAASAPDR